MFENGDVQYGNKNLNFMQRGPGQPQEHVSLWWLFIVAKLIKPLLTYLIINQRLILMV